MTTGRKKLVAWRLSGESLALIAGIQKRHPEMDKTEIVQYCIARSAAAFPEMADAALEAIVRAVAAHLRKAEDWPEVPAAAKVNEIRGALSKPHKFPRQK